MGVKSQAGPVRRFSDKGAGYAAVRTWVGSLECTTLDTVAWEVETRDSTRAHMSVNPELLHSGEAGADPVPNKAEGGEKHSRVSSHFHGRSIARVCLCLRVHILHKCMCVRVHMCVPTQ